ncbi:MAG: type II toxin-antitoxin system VapC family toxin [Actinomycetota bacterium]|nr:type II toxin-antitoxin system VapC family toxin [Euzebyaceae bacterium]MDQ3452474.1 type II toxin-antitoxin system VapC family toxin [Actinomycetota bacterium]
MNAYFDTSAIVPLLIDEPSSDDARRLWDEAIRIVSVRLLYPEARAATAQAHRVGRLTAPQLRAAVGALDDRYPQVDVVQIDDELARRAGEFAEVHGLRGYDAVHLAAADRAGDTDLVVVAGDRALLNAAASVGLMTASIG